MSQGIQRMALWALAVVGMAWAGSGSTNISPSQETNASSAQGDSTSNPSVDKSVQASQRKQARAARHAGIDKAREQTLDSVRAAFAVREAAEVAGSSEIVNEKLQQQKAAKQKGK